MCVHVCIVCGHPCVYMCMYSVHMCVHLDYIITHTLRLHHVHTIKITSLFYMSKCTDVNTAFFSEMGYLSHNMPSSQLLSITTNVRKGLVKLIMCSDRHVDPRSGKYPGVWHTVHAQDQ